MCHPSCDSLDSSRRIWIEIDSQILNALFCVTGFGLAPWRIRDLYQWSFWRLGWSEGSRRKGLDRLAEIHKNWFLTAHEPSVLPIKAQQHYPLIEQATPTQSWKMDVVVWGNILNTVFQICLAVCMWAWNRFDRPSWTTGLFVGLACVVAGVPGILMWLEKKRLKKASEHPGALLLIPRATQTVLPSGGRGDFSYVNSESCVAIPWLVEHWYNYLDIVRKFGFSVDLVKFRLTIEMNIDFNDNSAFISPRKLAIRTILHSSFGSLSIGIILSNSTLPETMKVKRLRINIQAKSIYASDDNKNLSNACRIWRRSSSVICILVVS